MYTLSTHECSNSSRPQTVRECAQPYTSNTDTYLCSIKINTQWGLEPWNLFQRHFVPFLEKSELRLSLWYCRHKWVWSSTVESAAVYFKCRDSYTLLQIHSLIGCHVSSVMVEPGVFTFDPRGTDVRMYTRCPRTYTKANINIQKAHRG